MLAAITGSVITATTWFMGAVLHPWLHGAGTALLITTIPLLILSGYCLDWAEQTPKQNRTGGFHDADQH
jgi:fido (protein-threonine AMPylation protein)